eukprot:5378998-Prymnesium_polylepis.1
MSNVTSHRGPRNTSPPDLLPHDAAHDRVRQDCGAPGGALAFGPGARAARAAGAPGRCRRADARAAAGDAEPLHGDLPGGG